MREIISAAATKPFGFMKFNPSIGVGGHCIPVDPNYLLYSSRKYNVDLKLIDHSNNVNLNMPEVIVKRIENFLNYSLKNLRIQIAGIAYKSNVADTRESPAIKIMEILRGRGAIVSWCDPLVLNYNSEESSPLSAQIDLGLIVTPHSNIDFTIWSISGTKVLDLSSESKNYGWPKFI
jgi:UDP-N-acetyl-D-glucosamine dehydrogenase